jgi:hypothetical protein
MEIPSWFKEDWIDTDAKALGLYIALLYSIFEAVHLSFNKDSTINNVKVEIAKKLAGKDAFEASISAETFLENLYTHEYSRNKGFKSETGRALSAIEGKYFEKFRKACYKYFKKRYIEWLEDEDKKALITILERLKLKPNDLTISGSVYKILDIYYSDHIFYELATGIGLYSLKPDEKEKQSKRMKNLLETLNNSGILWFNRIIPAPFLEEEFIAKLTSPEEIIEESIPSFEAELRTAPPFVAPKEVKEFEGKKPEWKILEEIVGKNLKSMGFNYELNKRLSARGGGTIEVDVWAWKRIGNTTFYVYASCKNWDKEVDRSVIDEEFGRTMQLFNIPHLKIFVAKKLTAPAKDAALADGFIVIELGEKVLTNNAQEIYNIIYSHLKELFIGIAPPELQRFAQLAREFSDKLRALADQIEKISG